MKGGVTRAIEEAIEALDKGQLKKALFILDKEKTAKQHAIVSEAARQCLSDKESCPVNLKDARDQLQAMLTNPLEDTSLEGLEEMLKERQPVEPELKDATTDEELYEECEECHIANAVVAATEICDKHPHSACSVIIEKLDKEDIQPEQWLKALRRARNEVEGEAKAEFDMILDDLAGYLERRKSPFLKHLTED